jgi:hypothetical protein
MQLGQLARERDGPLGAENPADIGDGGRDPVAGLIEDQRARLLGKRGQPGAPGTRTRRQKAFEDETIAG